jgi:hypothetical protein
VRKNAAITAIRADIVENPLKCIILPPPAKGVALPHIKRF